MNKENFSDTKYFLLPYDSAYELFLVWTLMLKNEFEWF